MVSTNNKQNTQILNMKTILKLNNKNTKTNSKANKHTPSNKKSDRKEQRKQTLTNH